MPSETIEKLQPFILQVSAEDLGPLFIDCLHLDCAERSPLREILASYRPGSGSASGALADLLSRPEVRTAGEILASPTLRIETRTGGGALAVSGSVACLNREVDTAAVVEIQPSENGAFVVELFASPWEFLAHWLKTHANGFEGTLANALPPPLRLEETAYLLHALDFYRRKAYESMLAYTPAERVTVSLPEFVGSFKKSLESSDYRWLLPAFTGLTPGVAEVTFDPSPALMEALVVHDFLLPVRGGEDLIFGETLQVAGVEFYRTWMRAAGIEIAVKTGVDWEISMRGFLAPTGAANHLFLIERNAEGDGMVNHQPYPMSMLEDRMARLLAQALGAEQAAPAAAPFCASCGKRLPIKGKFCPFCGEAR